MNELIITMPPGVTGARQDITGAAKILGVREHDIPTLVRARLLKPLGAPEKNAPKYFATCNLIQLANDVQWLDRATRAITQNWRHKNSQRSGGCQDDVAGFNGRQIQTSKIARAA